MEREYHWNPENLQSTGDVYTAIILTKKADVLGDLFIGEEPPIKITYKNKFTYINLLWTIAQHLEKKEKQKNVSSTWK